MASVTIHDTHAAVKGLIAKGASKELAEEIVTLVQTAEIKGESETRADLADLKTDVYKAMLVQTGSIIAALIGILALFF
ncbi:hypothetical protein [uncultured Tateyamaria sp.]|uniref:hypothetical protein n=1 Tax=uncultured Tateyamaria sp. TaxID=455651 RepID=UPI00262E16C0|nr:hypothetical protein [uncultured Tateyamaria sp.]